MLNKLPAVLFSLPLTTTPDYDLSLGVPRAYAQTYSLHDAWLGNPGTEHFIAAIANEPPTIRSVSALKKAVGRIDSRQLAICWDAMDIGMMRALSREGVSYIRDSSNAYLPFLGATIMSENVKVSTARPLSPQAQRIVLNLIAGRWDNKTAGELAKLCGKSLASVSGYLAEIQSIAPGLVERRGRSRMLRSNGYSKKELLEGFDEYLTTPVSKRIRLQRRLKNNLLSSARVCYAGETALCFVSDLAPDDSRAVVAGDKSTISELHSRAGDSWVEAKWYEPCEMEVEIWSYPIDESTRLFPRSVDLACVDPFSLYVECSKADCDDIRYLDAVEQLKELLCQR